MPHKPRRPCRHPGCPNLCDPGEVYCKAHISESEPTVRAREYERFRGSAASRGYDSRWQKARLSFLRAHPLCAECAKAGRYTAATVVDHIIPHRGDQKLFWDPDNWQSLCKYHHDQKTARGL